MLPGRLTTPRLDLIPIEAAHAPSLFEACNSDPWVTRYLTWRAHGMVEETEAFIARCVASADSRTFVLKLRSDDQIVGTFRMAYQKPFAIQIGYLLAQNHWGRDFVSEAIVGSAHWCLGQADIFRFGATCDVENRASARAMEKAGMVREGILKRWMIHPNVGPEPRDCYSYAITR